ncbi:flagellar filament capping protein FliD [Pantoea sp. EABMAA-21]|uniref:flagellar filament capping protein FliD n=1 Tax=Pantoea sp. EABMAA-21 TaxID=3043302 RepID=UPI0024B4F6EC|nr:flagellar filament capping protein FliD [Pantoea sp. EABMAA-21]MDI9279070.1 flagellar filament capping protein FliD [Pantoea sp. EABMAA-21]
MTTPISGLGGSGLDIPALMEQIKNGESKKLNPYLNKQSKFNGQVSSWGKISNSLASLKSNLDKLQNEGFNGVSIGDNKAFKATAGKGAIPDSYSVIVEKLAKAHKIGSPEQDSNSAQLGDGSATRTLTITLGNGKPLSVELKDDETSLAQVAKKINAQNGDVSASVMPAEGGKFQLVVTSKKTGSDGQIKMEVSGDSQLAGVLNYDPKAANVPGDPGYDPTRMKQISAAQNALMKIDGITVERSSNTISDAIEGITFELREVSEKDPDDPGQFKPETLSVTADTSKVKSLIEEFINNYNSFLSTSASASTYKPPEKNSDEQNKQNGPLFSDGTLRRLNSQMKSAAGGNYGESSELYHSLASIGITVKFEELKPGEDRTATLGTLSIDSKKLDAALKEHPKEVEALFLGKDGAQGIKGQMGEVFKSYLGDNESIPKTEGTIASTVKGLKDQEARVAKQIERMEQRIEESLKRQQKEFMRLDKAMTDMQAMSNQLQGALAGLG